MDIALYSPTECEHIESVAQQLDEVLKALVRHALDFKQGATSELESIARALLREQGLSPALSCLVSPITQRPYDCVGSYSLNEELTHAPPSNRIICDGDVLTIDIAASAPTPSGVWFADMSRCVCFGGVRSSRGNLLCEIANTVVESCISRCKAGVRWREIASFAQQSMYAQGMCIASEYCGHGIGRNLHEQPIVTFDLQRTDCDFVLQKGMVFTIEPIIVEETTKPQLSVREDGWTVVEAKGRWSAYLERMVIVR